MPARTTMAPTSPMAVDRRLSPSPPPQPLSKRDKRRNNITEKLSDMIETFTNEQPMHYRAQLQAIQVDMTLISRADPYQLEPLDDSAEAIEQEIELITGGSVPGIETAKRDYLALAGKRYHEYIQKINEAKEQRDADLVATHNKYSAASAELERTTSFKIEVARREHQELAATIRSRLINSVTKKRDKLLREKEQLDIADSSALFLHPGQFSINIPNSPGGVAGNRKTRHTRHRVDPDEAAERGRKRKALADDDGNDSPAPSFRPLANDNGGASSPYRDARAKTVYTQYEAPAFSIDRLFTEKELVNATNIAQIATHHFFHHQQNMQSNGDTMLQANGHPASVMSLDGSAGEISIPLTTVTSLEDPATAAQANGSPPPSQPQAVEMERTVSYHATRGATKANPLAALSDMAAMAANTNAFTPVLIPITRTDKGAPTPPGVTMYDADQDIAMMMKQDDLDAPMNGAGLEATRPESNLHQMRERLLEQACRETTGVAPFRLPILETGPSSIRGGVNRIPAYGFADPASMRFALSNGAASSSAAAAAGAASPAIVNGNLAALATASAGGVPMSRATSMGGSDVGAGSEAGGAGVRRVRSRLV